ncbi:uncharacterized protein LOC122535771 isoform X1 [Frieseomelitta varia]|uniref:uncharacterized protein LOC122535771 isoform X1 n=1 Tax=Frieseomelitta varia TaxID=561572 RepID=UPI001CB6A1E6|nr:uncharacterized protein LOC122535771 isoform X1 [Frieseomelitta varia]
MSRLTAWIAALLILIGSVWSQVRPATAFAFQELDYEQILEEARFGFNFLEPLRRSFCQNFCTSFETMPYIANLACAVKCPELYLPHTTKPSTATTPLPITTTQTPLTAPIVTTTTTLAPITPAMTPTSETPSEMMPSP